MKKHALTPILLFVVSAGLLLNGCQSIDLPEAPDQTETEQTAGTVTAEIPEAEPAAPASTSAETAGYTVVTQGGPYGEISLSIPDGWCYETGTADDGQFNDGLYGIRFYPGDAADGYIVLTYTDWFGVCGTGLATEETAIAGHPATIGTYDQHMYWNFISFQDDYDGIVTLTFSVENWWSDYSGQVMEILDTLSFDKSVREGSACVYSRDSEADQIGLSLSLKKITPAGVTLVWQSYDASAPTGQLECGDDFAIEVQKDGMWEEAPVSLEGNYAFHDAACTISAGDSTEQELNWEWLYGTLAPGTYRIRKSILDFRAAGDYDTYTVYAQFILN